MKPIYRTILIHAALWLLYLVIPALIIPNALFFTPNGAQYIYPYLFVGSLSIILFYFTIHVLIPKFFIRKKHFLFFLLGVASIILVMIIVRNVYLFLGWDNAEVSMYKNALYVIRVPLIFFLALGLFLNQRYRQLEVESLQSELTALKAQIDPHFLFNVLNDLYGQALMKSDSTADNILKLSSIMRYVTNEANTKAVDVEDELKYLSNYIDLQKSRLTSSTTVEFNVKNASKGEQIPPLLLISFIENAFKYGVSNERDSIIHIEIEIKDRKLMMLVKNDVPNNRIHESPHIGIKNTERRLNLLYGNQYELKIEDQKEHFVVNLSIPLND
ncbi:MAG: hypothetical protein ACI837_003160 [Crocinitomicaceae bacterium]|jgi:hypothetical protein